MFANKQPPRAFLNGQAPLIFSSENVVTFEIPFGNASGTAIYTSPLSKKQTLILRLIMELKWLVKRIYG